MWSCRKTGAANTIYEVNAKVLTNIGKFKYMIFRLEEFTDQTYTQDGGLTLLIVLIKAHGNTGDHCTLCRLMEMFQFLESSFTGTIYNNNVIQLLAYLMDFMLHS